MRYVPFLILISLQLSGCSQVPIEATPQFIARIAPDTPAIDKKTQVQAAKEMQERQCPALNDLANLCLMTRDQARLLRK